MADHTINFVDGLHLLDVPGEIHDEALPIVAFEDALMLGDTLNQIHYPMPVISFEDGLILSDARVDRPNQRYEIDFSDGLGFLDIVDMWRGEHYYQTFEERLLLADHSSRYATQRRYLAFNDRLPISDSLNIWKGDHFYENPDDILGLSDEMWTYHTHRHYVIFEDRFSLADEMVLKYALFVIGGTGDGYYQHGSRVPITVELEGNERFLAWAGEKQYVEDIYALSTFIHMPNETVRIEAIKGDVSLQDITALGGRVTAANLDMVMEQGATFERNLYYKDPDGNPVDMSGWTAAMHVRARKGASETLLTLTSSAADIILGGATGHLEIHIPANVMDDLNFVWGFYDLELYPSGDETKAFRLLEGRIRLTKEVTIL